MKPLHRFLDNNFALAEKALNHYFEEEGIYGYLDEIMSVLKGEPNYRVEAALADAADTYPSDYVGWEEDSEFEMLDKYLKWEGILGYADRIWKIFQNPQQYLDDFGPKAENRYEVELVLSPIELEIVKNDYSEVEVTDVEKNHPNLPINFSYVTLVGDREQLLGIVRWLQYDADVELFGGEMTDDDDIVNEHFKIVDKKADKMEDEESEEEEVEKDYYWRNDFMTKNAKFPYGYNMFKASSFEELSHAALNELVEKGFADREDSQNDSPTIGWFLEHMPVSAKFGGYLIPPAREDVRISIDLVEMSISEFMGLPEEVKEVLEEADEADLYEAEDRAVFWWD